MDIHPQTLSSLHEAIRDIRVRAGLEDLARKNDGGSVTIGITSPRSGEGKTTIAVALAGSLADDLGAEVTLVDADFRTHSIAGEYGLMGERGFAEAIGGGADVSSVRHRLEGTTLSVIGVGEEPVDAERGVQTYQAASVVERLRTGSSFVVLDMPAALHTTATPILARHCDAIVVVVRTGASTRQDLERTLDRLSGAPRAGRRAQPLAHGDPGRRGASARAAAVAEPPCKSFLESSPSRRC